MGFDISKACKHIVYMAGHTWTRDGKITGDKNKNSGYGQCVGHVRQALKASGFPNFNYCQSGWKFGESLKSLGGWSRIDNQVRIEGKNVYGCQYGDICCCDSTKSKKSKSDGKPIGHGALYTPNGWVSDFIQAYAIPYPLNTIITKHTSVWRYTGDVTNSMDFSINDMGTYDSSGGNAVDEEARRQLADINAAIMARNAYPVHNEYTLFNESYNNLFDVSNNTISSAMFSDSSNIVDNTYKNKQGRIYSTNDALLVLDELSLPIDYQNDVFISSDIKNNSQRTQLQAKYDKMSIDDYGNGKKPENNNNTDMQNTSTS